MLRGVGLGGGKGDLNLCRWGRESQALAALWAEFCPRRDVKTTGGTAGAQPLPALLAELGSRIMLVLALWTLHAKAPHNRLLCRCSPSLVGHLPAAPTVRQ